MIYSFDYSRIFDDIECVTHTRTLINKCPPFSDGHLLKSAKGFFDLFTIPLNLN